MIDGISKANDQQRQQTPSFMNINSHGVRRCMTTDLHLWLNIICCRMQSARFIFYDGQLQWRLRLNCGSRWSDGVENRSITSYDSSCAMLLCRKTYTCIVRSFVCQPTGLRVNEIHRCHVTVASSLHNTLIVDSDLSISVCVNAPLFVGLYRCWYIELKVYRISTVLSTFGSWLCHPDVFMCARREVDTLTGV